MHYVNPTKNETCKRTSMIPYVRLLMWFPNVTKCIAPFSDWLECEWDSWIHIFMTRVVTFWIQPSDSSIQAGFPPKKQVFNWLVHQAYTHRYMVNFHLKKALGRMGKWSAISTRLAWKYTCPGQPIFQALSSGYIRRMFHLPLRLITLRRSFSLPCAQMWQ